MMNYSSCIEAFNTGQIVFYQGNQQVRVEGIHTYPEGKWAVEISRYPSSSFTRNPTIFIGYMARDQPTTWLSITRKG